MLRQLICRCARSTPGTSPAWDKVTNHNFFFLNRPAACAKAWDGPKKTQASPKLFPDQDLGDAQPLRSTKIPQEAHSGTASSPPLARS